MLGRGPADSQVGPFRRWYRSVYRSQRPLTRDFIDRVYDSLLPPRDESILLSDEEIYYKSRRHIAEILQPVMILVGTAMVAFSVSFDIPFVDREVLGFGVLVLISGFVPALIALDRSDIVRALKSAVPWAVVSLAVSFAFNAPWVPATAALVWVAARLGLRVFRWRFFRVLYVTNRRLIQTEGFLSRRQATLPLSRVTDVALSYSFVGEYLNYATFRVESAGQTLFRQIDFLASPEAFHQMVVYLATSARPLPEEVFDPVTGEHKKWKRVIDEGLTPRRRRRDDRLSRRRRS